MEGQQNTAFPASGGAAGYAVLAFKARSMGTTALPRTLYSSPATEPCSNAITNSGIFHCRCIMLYSSYELAPARSAGLEHKDADHPC
jgi:hypothetical protein